MNTLIGELQANQAKHERTINNISQQGDLRWRNQNVSVDDLSKINGRPLARP